MSNFSLGIDIGGTFSDLVMLDTEGKRLLAHKELTTHDDPARGVMTAIDKLLSSNGLSGADVGRVVHATTLFTNALLERRGATTGLLSTRGFRDVIEIGRERRYELFDLNSRRPLPLVPRNLRREVPERIDRDGRVRTALDIDELLKQTASLVSEGVDSIAIVFLHSYANPVHERSAANEIARAFPSLSVSYSYEVAPVIRENERASTTVANAYMKPLASRYLDNLVAGLATRGVTAQVLMMLSSGGLSSLEDVKRCPVKAVESGPAAGVIAAATFAMEDGESELLSFDLGGTTAKLCVVTHGKPSIAQVFEAAREKRFLKGSGIPIRTPTVELIEIGAGGGSIARKDNLGLLKVGPDSAGSLPGPACYGQGGTSPTVTDANFLLGYLDRAAFAGGSIDIDLDAAQQAIRVLGEQCAMTPTRTAWGIVDIVNETMSRAAAVHIAEHGKDPRNFVLVATGGGGPLHAYSLAKKLGIRRVLCPANAGVASAIGLLRAPASVSAVRSVLLHLDRIDWSGLEAAFDVLQSEACDLLAKTGASAETLTAARQADLRYAGQAFELVVPMPPGPYGPGHGRAGVLAAFEQCYRDRYAVSPRSTDVELVNIRVIVTAASADEGRAGWTPPAGEDMHAPEVTERLVFFPENGAHCPTRVYRRSSLAAGVVHRGPAVIEDAMSTILVGPASSFEMRQSGHVMITLDEESQGE